MMGVKGEGGARLASTAFIEINCQPKAHKLVLVLKSPHGQSEAIEEKGVQLFSVRTRIAMHISCVYVLTVWNKNNSSTFISGNFVA